MLAGLLLLLARAHAATAPALNTELIGQFDGPDTSVAISGHYLYLCEGATLRILDISNPAAPVETGRVLLHFTGSYRVVVAGDLAYVVSYDFNISSFDTSIGYFDIVDVHDPAAPRRRSSLALQGYPVGVAVEGNLACVGSAYALHLIDVSHPDQPIIVKSYTGGYGFVELRDGLAYTTNNQDFQILDVHDPGNPVLRGSFTTPDAIIVGLSGNLAILGSYGSFSLINISNLGNPTLLSRITYGTSSYGLLHAAIIDQNAYLVDCARGLLVYDIDDPTSPILKSTRKFASPTGGAIDLAIDGHIAYVPYFNGFQVLDLSDPSSIKLLADYKKKPTNNFNDVATTGSLACLLGANQLTTVDLKEPASAHRLGSLALASDDLSTPKHMALTGHLGLIAAGTLGMQVVDLSRPTTPTLLTTYNTPGTAFQVATDGSLAYVADGSDGLLIFDITKPTVPKLRHRIAESGIASSVALTDGRAYVTNTTGLLIFDVHDPDQPQALGSLAITEGGNSVVVDGSTAYVLVNAAVEKIGVVYVIDIHDPTTPTLLKKINLTTFSNRIEVDQGLLYATARNYLTIYDVHDPRAPRLQSKSSYFKYGPITSHGIFYLPDQYGSVGLYWPQIPVRLLSPNGGQTLRGGDAVTVHWKTDLQVAGTAVRLELWNRQGRVAILGEGWNPLGEGETTVLVPLVPEGSDYRLRAASSWAPSLYDEADAPFTILANPNAGVEAARWALYQ